jgi:hypothetical protein
MEIAWNVDTTACLWVVAGRDEKHARCGPAVFLQTSVVVYGASKSFPCVAHSNMESCNNFVHEGQSQSTLNAFAARS